MHRSDTNGMGGLGCSIRPGAPAPETVLVVVMNDSSYLLVGYPQGGPSAYVTTKDAAPLRQVLAAAFGGEQSADNKTEIPGSDLIRGKATQS